MSLAETARQETFKTFVRDNSELVDMIMNVLKKATRNGARCFTLNLLDQAVLNAPDLIAWLRYEEFNVERTDNMTLIVSW